MSTWKLERAAVVGAGAMGASLAAALSASAPTVLICRNPERAATLLRDGVVVEGLVERRARPIVLRTLGELASLGGASVVFVATKTTAIPQVASELKPLLRGLGMGGGECYVVSYQNGIEPGRQLMGLLESERVLRMVLSLGAVLEEGTGAVRVTLHSPPHAIGCLDSSHVGVCETIGGALTAGGLPTRYSSDIEGRVWEKGILNASMNPIAALVNSSVGEVMESPARLIVERLVREGESVARGEGIGLEAGFSARAMEILRGASGHTPSMVEDIRRGRESEVGQLNRQILEHARRAGVSAPTHEVIDALIETFDWKVYRRSGARG